MFVGFVLNENRPDGDPAVRVIQQFESQLKAHQVPSYTLCLYFFERVGYAAKKLTINTVALPYYVGTFYYGFFLSVYLF